MKRWALMATLLFALTNCSTNDSVKPIHGDGLAGTWLLYETGYSPGSGYIITPVPQKPEQTLTFMADGHMQAQGDGLKYYQSFSQYRVDTVNRIPQIQFFPTEAEYVGTQQIDLRQDTLILRPYCIEGCHSGFVRIK